MINKHIEARMETMAYPSYLLLGDIVAMDLLLVNGRDDLVSFLREAIYNKREVNL